ncbi:MULTISPECIES: sulfurtransferase complex subunit TusC [unclassified Pseudoalteromonas]|uniref:sulfurtransferase complex subunit TusC n=1 Tax=unclassified Pseudoalteromonas TaxID=194690 RepID=UPI001107EB50|nr:MULTISPECIES: sulfurtransferase complex subunit TusC [unclassified Pseudoalteromonas]TMN82998.1 sulfurtransferase complex subunit TusC [Pseudoalteromonas sp. S410]TMN90189.1 sulfurtransferase complex subunit TusC [Pseudoalteromonas sp. S408]TMN99270.1 sulfurtransferase complex subunit TusC [Pseudoalteromonas sp. S409]TMO00751.1 sulfurtransferase complex subunit TusC [Pseudoalteromonas sp. S407]TMO09474.1 sulfurtransferase complex subunit TusC [Pseudoalteromonas sp. S186]
MINVLVMSQSSPFDDLNLRDALDMTLIFAAVDQNISWLFSGPAVLALKKHQTPSTIGIKDFFKNIKTLEIYDVENIYVCEKSLLDYGLSKTDLLIDAYTMTFSEQQTLIKKQHHVVTL